MLWFADVDLRPRPRILRQFAFACLVLVGGGGVWRIHTMGPGTASYTMTALGVGVGIAGLIAPRLIRWIYAAATVVSFPIGWVVSRILLGVVYYFLLTPVALVMRVAGRDRLRLRPPSESEDSLWIRRDEPTDASRYLQQY